MMRKSLADLSRARGVCARTHAAAGKSDYAKLQIRRGLNFHEERVCELLEKVREC